jgi:hypothetical protein
MLQLTKQEQTVLIIVILLLLTGWVVRAYRTAHPPNSSPGEFQHGHSDNLIPNHATDQL